MKSSRLPYMMAFAALALFGCRTASSPYDYRENWLIREDPTRTFVVPSDLIYVQGELYLSITNLPAIHSYACAEVGCGRFSSIARVFSPLVTTREDLEKALDWYFKYHHTEGRPFTFIGEGEGGRFLWDYEVNNAGRLRKLGLVASYYTETSGHHFVTEEMVKEIKHAVSRARYKSVWGRDMPEGMINED